MADENWVEVEIKTRNAAGDTAVGHLEYDAKTATPGGAAAEIIDHVVKQVGNDRTHLPDVDR